MAMMILGLILAIAMLDAPPSGTSPPEAADPAMQRHPRPLTPGAQRPLRAEARRQSRLTSGVSEESHADGRGARKAAPARGFLNSTGLFTHSRTDRSSSPHFKTDRSSSPRFKPDRTSSPEDDAVAAEYANPTRRSRNTRVRIDDLLTARGLEPSNQPNASMELTLAEGLAFLDALLRLRDRKRPVYVEWGTGGSTELVSWLIISKRLPELTAYAVESSVAWMAYLRERSNLVAVAEATGQLKFHHGDMGRTAHLGYPVAFHPGQTERALQYVSLDSVLGAGQAVDLALVDGRFRLACALEALPRLAETGVMIIHDYHIAPPGIPASRFRVYAKANRYYTLSARNESLATFVRNPDINVSSSDVANDMVLALRVPD